MNPRLKNILRSSLPGLMLIAGLLAPRAFGQSLSIIKKPDNKYSVEATSPVNTPHDLQGSANLHLWVDLKEDVAGAFSYPFNTNGVSQRYFRLTPAAEPAETIRLLIIGDSMPSDCCGWGGGLYGYFKENAKVVNYSTAWYSTRVFMQSEEWDKMRLIKPKYVLIQFGYMDEVGDVERYTTLEEFRANLRTIAEAVRSFNGIPIFVTLHAFRYWDDQGKLIDSPQPRREVMMEVASEMQAPLIDLYKLSFEMFSKLGPENSKPMNYSVEDVAHLSPLGAIWVSRLVANALPKELGPYLTKILDQPPAPAP